MKRLIVSKANLNELNRDLGRCKECGKRIPARNNQISMECQKAGLCRTCYETTYTECKECGKPLPQGKGLKRLAARQLGYCTYCYEAKFPELPARGALLIGDLSGTAEINEPSDSPWEWLESVREMYDE